MRVSTGQSWTKALQPLFESSCLSCHDQSASGGLDLTTLDSNLEDASTFRRWERLYDRVQSGEMPPEGEPRPEPGMRRAFEQKLERVLLQANRTAQQANGRTIMRRLSRTEFESVVHDLLQIQGDLASLLPEENATGFDTVAASQGMSPQHIRSYLAAADRAIDLAIRLDPPPAKDKPLRIHYKKHPEIRTHIESPDVTQKIVRELDDAIVAFTPASYLYKVPEFYPTVQGRYRMRGEVYGYQTDRPVILTFNVGNYGKGSVRVLRAFDILPNVPTQVEVEMLLEPGEYLFPDVVNLQLQEDGLSIWNVGPEKYTGAGVAIRWIEVEGPFFDQWPPASTTRLLKGIELRKLESAQWNHELQKHLQYELVQGEDPQAQLETIVKRLAPRAFRRPLEPNETLPFVRLGMEVLENGGSFERAIRVSLRAVLTSPQFLYWMPPAGKLDDFALASRLSLFLWHGLPDATLFRLANQKQLTTPETLRTQVDRMLLDPRSKRMIDDFARQWLRLGEIDATSPDMQLYPEYDELLKQAMLAETREYLAYLIAHDEPCDRILHSDFTFLNRRLAEHYGIAGIEGQEMRKVDLPANSPRGGILTQASILKITANGTTTSPVRRGSWVLTHLLGQPPNPPPPSVGSIEPDTRGATTIRELLDKHRNDATCATCHRSIDPPGFALESFDVIGGYRERFRSKEQGEPPSQKLQGRYIWEYKLGPPVDSSGTLPNGESFQNIRDYKRLLLTQREQIARNLITQWVVYATGCELQFADRQAIEGILERCRASDFRIRSMIHEVIQSELFLHK